jgi:hypothetical protein
VVEDRVHPARRDLAHPRRHIRVVVVDGLGAQGAHVPVLAGRGGPYHLDAGEARKLHQERPNPRTGMCCPEWMTDSQTPWTRL